MDKRKRTKYQRLQAAAKNYCKTGSSSARERLKKAEKAYVEDAKKKGKSSAEIKKTVSGVKKCSAKVSGTKRKSSRKRK